MSYNSVRVGLNHKNSNYIYFQKLVQTKKMYDVQLFTF